MEKTALQQFIEAISNSGIVIINQTLIDNCLQIENHQIVTAHLNGQSVFDRGAYREEVKKYAEQYYQETFKSEKK
jgi:hypothetical protein